MQSELFRLDLMDIVKGLIVSVFAAVITVLYGVTVQSGFDLFTADWTAILQDVVQVAVTTSIAYLAKNFLSNDEGAPLGIS